MPGPLLTICLPTYNRGKYVSARLEQLCGLIRPEFADQLEVLVSNNGSLDDTKDQVAAWNGRVPNLRYSENPINYGYDYNLLKCLSLARGEYVWVFGDDDYFLDGAVAEVLRMLASREYSCLILNQAIGETYGVRATLGERIYDIAENQTGTLHELSCKFGFLNLLGFVSALVFRKPAFEQCDWLRHLSYDSALVHSSVIYESCCSAPSVMVANPLLRVEPPAEHQTREHQMAQDPRVNFRTWTLNLTQFMVDMKKRGLLQGEESTRFYHIKHCDCSLADHVMGSFKGCISEFREVLDPAWAKYQAFLLAINDKANLAYLEKLKAFQAQLFADILRIRGDEEIRGNIWGRASNL